MVAFQFTKMHGLGNDFAVVNATKQAFSFSAAQIVALANRHTGIGFDQLLLIEPGQHADFFCRIYNADGTEALQCGNGLRCVTRYIYDNKLHAAPTFTIETRAGCYPVHFIDNDHITVTMGAPEIKESALALNIAEQIFNVTVLSVGNPHIILPVDDVTTTPVPQLGAQLGAHPLLAESANIGFMQLMNPRHIRLRTYERGTGETHACGSNACAAAVAGIMQHGLEPSVQVSFRYGSLQIEWDRQKNSIKMTGPATTIYAGDYR